MRKLSFWSICFMVIQLLLGSPFSVSARTVVKVGHASVYSLYDVVEISLSVNSPSVNNPFTQVTTRASFTTPSSATKNVKGFCDSNDGSIHRVRFTPTETGLYYYTITFNDPHGQETFTGSFAINDSKGNKGFVGTDPDYPDAFMYSNGEHPFICSKTAWLICGITESNYRGYIDKMPARNENCIRFGLEFDYSFAEPYIDVWPWEGDRSSPDYTRYDIDFWRKVDRIIQYAADRDIMSEVVVFTGMRTKLDWHFAEPYLEYVLARLACYPSIILFQTNNEYKGPDEGGTDSKAYLEDIADYIHANDPFGHLVAPARRSIIYSPYSAWPDENWVDVVINHWAKKNENSLIKIRNIATSLTQYGKPAWSDETAREDRHENNCAVHRRKQYWTWNMSGVFWCFHSLEGSEGIVDLSYNGPGYQYEAYIRSFWERTEFWKMQVNNSIIRNDPVSLYEWCYASDKEAVIYMVNGPDQVADAWYIDDQYTSSGELRVRLPEGNYDVEFYNPSNGTFYTSYKQSGITGGQNVTVTYPAYNHDLVVYFKADEPLVTTADFSAQPQSGFKPLQVQFSDLSENAWAWQWDFGDNSAPSFSRNPVHTYSSAGYYTVTLTVTGDGGVKTKVRQDYIHVTEKPVRFTDITEISGTVGFSNAGYGRAAVFSDANRDGWIDLWVSNAGGDANTKDMLYINDGGGLYKDEAETRNVADQGYTHAVVCADFDNDGFQDVFFANQPNGADIELGKNRLYRNTGLGFFQDVTAASDIADSYSYSRGAIVLDMNKDGYQDVFVANWGAQNETYVNDGAGHLLKQDRGLDGVSGDVTAKQGVTAADVDNDGDTDIYICRRDADNQLYINNGNGYFTDEATGRGCNIGGLSHGATFADVDTDGDMDLFVVNYADAGSSVVPPLNVLINNGSGHFTNATAQYDIDISGYTVAFGDLDNDTDPDMFLLKNAEKEPGALPVVLLNDGNGGFEALSDIGLENAGQDNRSAVLGDIDHDGDLDVYITCSKSGNILYRNDLTNDNHYIQVLCEGPKGDFGGYGTRVWVYEPGFVGNNDYLLGYQESVSAFGYLGQNQTALHFGLGEFQSCDIRVKLLNGDQYDYSSVSADQLFEIDVYQALISPIVLQSQTKSSQNLLFTWTHVSGVDGYNVYRGVLPDLNGSLDKVATLINDENLDMPGVQWTDTDQVTGNVDVNYFYKITSVRNGEESGFSAPHAEFDYSLSTTVTTDFNDIAIPLFIENITNAQDLLEYIPQCNSVASWVPEVQDYQQYIPGFELYNFTIQMGYPYFVNMTGNTTLTMTGKVIYPVFNLITTSLTDFNAVTLPFDMSELTTASALMQDIPNCNSVAYWKTDIQGYIQYIPELSITDFSVRAGYPYYVNVVAGANWPERGLGKSAVQQMVVDAGTLSLAPHAVWGKSPGSDVKYFKAWLSQNPEQVLTQTSAGCFLNNEHWLVQAATFKEGWQPGNTLVTQFYDGNDQLVAVSEQALSVDAFDRVDVDALQLPDDFGLTQNYPNPFNPITTIAYQLPEQGHVSIKIYNTSGQWVKTLVDQKRQAGKYSIEWNGTDNRGLPVASGTYFYRMKAGDYCKILKAVYLK